MIRWPATELDPTSFPAWREAIARDDAQEHETDPHAPRSYPGYPRHALPKVARRWRSSLERALTDRRCARSLTGELPPDDALARLCWLAHGAMADDARGPVPSAGGLQALELYFAVLAPGWLGRGVHHYDRAAHATVRIADDFDRALVPGLVSLDGGALLWLIVGDGARAAARYGTRALRFLLLEAGHLMQNLCLVSAELGLSTVPIGGFFERPIAQAMQLLPDDEVLYAGVCGRPL